MVHHINNIRDNFLGALNSKGWNKQDAALGRRRFQNVGQNLAALCGFALMNRDAPTNERMEFFQVWHQVSAGLAAVAANLDRLPESRRGFLLEIVQDLQLQQARLFAEVEQLPATSVAAINYIQRDGFALCPGC